MPTALPLAEADVGVSSVCERIFCLAFADTEANAMRPPGRAA
jgi:hypothetical protein